MTARYPRSPTAYARRRLGCSSCLAWGGLFATAVDLDATLLSVERIANDHGYAGSAGLCNRMTRYAQVTPTCVRMNGGADGLLEVFLDRLARHH